METALRDKLSLLMGSPAVFPVPSDDPAFEEKMWRCFMKELPAFVHYLMNEHAIRP